MTTEIALTLSVLVITVTLFAMELSRVDVTALLIMILRMKPIPSG